MVVVPVPYRLGSPILGPLDIAILVQNARLHERSDILPHAVVEMGTPAERPLVPGPTRTLILRDHDRTGHLRFRGIAGRPGLSRVALAL
jgi:hypothetical protein